jgi:hypothetical protein
VNHLKQNEMDLIFPCTGLVYLSDMLAVVSQVQCYPVVPLQALLGHIMHIGPQWPSLMKQTRTQPTRFPCPDVAIRSSNTSRSNHNNPNHPQYIQRPQEATPVPTDLQATTPSVPPASRKSSNAPSADGSAHVTFWLQFQAEFGQCIRIVGSTDTLGTWKLRDGPELKWGEGHKWSVTVEVPAGLLVEYKYVVLQPDGVTALHWQQGNNAVLAVMVCLHSWNC